MPRKLRLGLALGAGSARGWAHIGVIRALEHPARKLAADDRGHSQHVARHRIEPFEPSEQDIPDAVRNVDSPDRSRQADLVSMAFDQPSLLQRSQDFLDEEGIALGFLVNEALQLRRHR